MPEQAAQIREALSQLQFAFLKIGGDDAEAAEAKPAGPEAEQPPPPETPPAAGPAESQSPTSTGPSEPEQPGSEDPGPAQKSGRLWVPGQ
jgi:hypothetical protein